MKAMKTYQSGIIFLEALIGILIFSMGILSLVAMQSASINVVADAQYRIEAVNAANQLLAQMWVNVDRTNPTTLQTSLATFNHRTTGNPDECSFTGPDSGNPPGNAIVEAWSNLVNTGDAGGGGSIPLLPGSKPTMQQIVVDPGSNNQVRITVCWQAPSTSPDTSAHRHTLVAYIN
jgi:type IV pilus assembly protein PilV